MWAAAALCIHSLCHCGQSLLKPGGGGGAGGWGFFLLKHFTWATVITEWSPLDGDR